MPEAGSAGEEDTRASKEIPWLIRLRENFRCAMATGVLSLYHADRKVGEGQRPALHRPRARGRGHADSENDTSTSARKTKQYMRLPGYPVSSIKATSASMRPEARPWSST